MSERFGGLSADVRLVPLAAGSVSIDDSVHHTVEANLEEGYVHLAVLPSRRRDDLIKTYKFDCRVIVLRTRTEPHAFDPVALGDEVADVIAFEERWRGAVGPADIEHPLLLPDGSFDVGHELHDFWARCDCYRDRALLTEANNSIQRFRKLHRRTSSGIGSYWQDIKRRNFIIDRSQHGRSIQARAGRRTWRFAFEVPPGFHYDVSFEGGSKVALLDNLGQMHSGDHINMNPWGVAW